MRKKELMMENRFFSEEMHKLKNDNNILRAELENKENEIELLYKKIEELNSALILGQQEESPDLDLDLDSDLEQQEIEEETSVEEEAEPERIVENIFDYAAIIIGKVIVSATENSTRIKCDDEGRKAETLNDILEHTEQVKSEILNIIATDDSYERKCRLMESEYQSAVSYFDRMASRF